MSLALLVSTGCPVACPGAGLMAGLFGIGGGPVMVPVLRVCFGAAGLPAEVIPPLALGTSLTTIGVTGALASRQHFRLGNLAQPCSARMRGLAAWLAAGVVAGAAVATRLPRNGMLLAVTQLQIGVATRMWLATPRPPTPDTAPAQPVAGRLRSRWAAPFMCLTGWVSAVGGIGGAALMVPCFIGAGLDHRGRRRCAPASAA